MFLLIKKTMKVTCLLRRKAPQERQPAAAETLRVRNDNLHGFLFVIVRKTAFRTLLPAFMAGMIYTSRKETSLSSTPFFQCGFETWPMDLPAFLCVPASLKAEFGIAAIFHLHLVSFCLMLVIGRFSSFTTGLPAERRIRGY
jgi:hypothetical protein